MLSSIFFNIMVSSETEEWRLWSEGYSIIRQQSKTVIGDGTKLSIFVLSIIYKKAYFLMDYSCLLHFYRCLMINLEFMLTSSKIFHRLSLKFCQLLQLYDSFLEYLVLHKHLFLLFFLLNIERRQYFFILCLEFSFEFVDCSVNNECMNLNEILFSQ